MDGHRGRVRVFAGAHVGVFVEALIPPKGRGRESREGDDGVPNKGWRLSLFWPTLRVEVLAELDDKAELGLSLFEIRLF